VCVCVCWFDMIFVYTQQRNIGWLRLVGSLKLQVSFAKKPYKRDYILQKRLVILRSLLIVATPYVCITRPTYVCECVWVCVLIRYYLSVQSTTQYLYVTRLAYVCECVWVCALIRYYLFVHSPTQYVHVTWLTYVCGCVWVCALIRYDLFVQLPPQYIYVIRLINVCDMTHPYTNATHWSKLIPHRTPQINQTNPHANLTHTSERISHTDLN